MDSLTYCIWVIVVFATSFIGMANINFANNKAHKQLVIHKPLWLPFTLIKPVYLRVIGWVFLAIAMILSVKIWGFSVGMAAYFGLLTLIVGVLAFLLSYKITWVIRLMGIAALLCLFYLGVLMAIEVS